MSRLILFFCVLSSSLATGQVFEGEITPEGIVYPRMDSMTRNTIVAIEGQCIYNTDTKRVDCYDGVSWNQSKFISIPSSAFAPSVDSNDIRWVADYQTTYFIDAPMDDRFLVAPVILEHGAIIKNITVYYTDQDPLNSVKFQLITSAVDLPSGWLIAGILVELTSVDTGTISGNPTIPAYGAVSTNTDIPISQLQSFSFRMYPSTSGTMGQNFKLNRVLIEYY